VVLRNVGGQTVNLTGYRLTDSDTRNVQAAQVSLMFSLIAPRSPQPGHRHEGVHQAASRLHAQQ
jgi:hypothetical protein